MKLGAIGVILNLALCLASTAAFGAEKGWPKIALEKVAGGFRQPTFIGHSGDGSGRLFIVERAGKIRIIKDGKVKAKPFLDITGRPETRGAEQGLLSVAFPPGFGKKKHFYVDYTGKKGLAGDTNISRFKVAANGTADASSEEVLLTIEQPYINHNGGQLVFGPDGFLYIGMGDGGSAGDPQNRAQNRKILLGKMLRIDVESEKKPYGIPADNPFGDEIWAWGLRNPWRFSFDRTTGDLYIADVGQKGWEEIDFQKAESKGGENYGWNTMEGPDCFKTKECSKEGFVLPVTNYGQGEGDCSVTGGYVYRGKKFRSLQGIYLYGDFCSGRIRGLRMADGKWESTVLLESKLPISTFGEDEEGNVYVADYNKGDIYRVVVK